MRNGKNHIGLKDSFDLEVLGTTLNVLISLERNLLTCFHGLTQWVGTGLYTRFASWSSLCSFSHTQKKADMRWWNKQKRRSVKGVLLKVPKNRDHGGKMEVGTEVKSTYITQLRRCADRLNLAPGRKRSKTWVNSLVSSLWKLTWMKYGMGIYDYRDPRHNFLSVKFKIQKYVNNRSKRSCGVSDPMV